MNWRYTEDSGHLLGHPGGSMGPFGNTMGAKGVQNGAQRWSRRGLEGGAGVTRRRVTPVLLQKWPQAGYSPRLLCTFGGNFEPKGCQNGGKMIVKSMTNVSLRRLRMRLCFSYECFMIFIVFYDLDVRKK